MVTTTVTRPPLFLQPLNREVVLDYVPFMSAKGTHEFWVGKHGLSMSGAATISSPQLRCTVPRVAGGKKEARLCVALNAGHSTDEPYPGFMFEQAWKFFSLFR